MPAVVLKNPIVVANRLEEIGVSHRELTEIVNAMLAARADCTDNDTPAAPGWLSWCMGVRRLRQLKISQVGWEKDETAQISSVLNRKLRVRIAISNTDDGTGDDSRTPQNNSKKGAATDSIVNANQLSFMDILDASPGVISFKKSAGVSETIRTWYLCVYSSGDVRRAELSCPVKVEAGYFGDFFERIFLTIPGVSDTDPKRLLNVGDNRSEYEIPVKRKP